jgi:MurNAc alpha-1-phosphate uridylyltransferase
MLLAAGRGERMRPLTDTTPKPLLQVQGQPLLCWHLQALAQAGVRKAVINTAWLGEQISGYFLDPKQALTEYLRPELLSISYSHEGQDFGCALETAGGIARALPQLGACRAWGVESENRPQRGQFLPDLQPHSPAMGPKDGKKWTAAVDSQPTIPKSDRLLGPVFWLAAGDVFAPGFAFDAAAAQAFAASTDLAHLWLVPNPPQHPRGDFGISSQGRALNLPADNSAQRYTYSTIALLRAELFAQPWCDIPTGNPTGIAAPLAPLLRRAMDADRVGASLYEGQWVDVGTPERLAALNAAAP